MYSLLRAPSTLLSFPLPTPHDRWHAGTSNNLLASPLLSSPRDIQLNLVAGNVGPLDFGQGKKEKKNLDDGNKRTYYDGVLRGLKLHCTALDYPALLSHGHGVQSV